MTQLTIIEDGDEVGVVRIENNRLVTTYEGDNPWIGSAIGEAQGHLEMRGSDFGETEDMVGPMEELIQVPPETQLSRLEASLAALPNVETRRDGGRGDGDDREMQSGVPDGAINIPDPSAAPPGAEVVQGPRGGWYYVPSKADTGEAGESGAYEEPKDAAEDFADMIRDAMADVGDGGSVKEVARMKRGDAVVEFYPPDQDTLYPSAVYVDETGEIAEATIRLGPLGERQAVDDSREFELEGEWADTVLEAASDAGIMHAMDDAIFDLGDAWVSDTLRPHVRFNEAPGVTMDEMAEFVGALTRRFENRFGDFMDRASGPDFGRENAAMTFTVGTVSPMFRRRVGGRKLQSSVPDGAINIPNPTDAPPGSEVVQGPRGGWYYIPRPGAETGEVDVGGDETAEAEPIESLTARISEWGERVNAYAWNGEPNVDFHTPMPGDQPIRSSLHLEGDDVVGGTIRYGVLDKDQFDGHPSADQEQIDRLKTAVERAGEPPEGTPVKVDFGDFHYPPRPHIRFRPPGLAGAYEAQGGREGIVYEGAGLRRPRAPVGEVWDYIQRAAEEIREEFAGEWSGEEPPTTAEEVVLEAAEPERFSNRVQAFIDNDPRMGAFLTPHSPEELADHTIIMSENDSAGVTVSPEGDIQNLFNADAPPGTGGRLVEMAIDEGARTLDCYAGHLPPFYARHGFRETGRMEFVDEFAPDGWDYDEFDRPDVVFMAYDPEAPVAKAETYYTTDQWDEAKNESRERAVD
jgi:hypothetical protein